MENFELVIDAYSTAEYGDGPAYAVVEVTPEFLARLGRLSELCRANNLAAVEVDSAPEHWDAEEDLRLQGDALRVQGGSFWFTAYPKHANYSVETRAMDIADLREVAEAGPGVVPENNCFQWSKGRLYFAGDAELAADLMGMIEEKGEDNEQ